MNGGGGEPCSVVRQIQIIFSGVNRYLLSYNKHSVSIQDFVANIPSWCEQAFRFKLQHNYIQVKALPNTIRSDALCLVGLRTIALHATATLT